MIFEAVIVTFIDLVSWLLGLLPADSFDWPDATVWKNRLAVRVGGLDAVFPLSETAQVLEELVTVALPVLMSFRLSLFIWFMLPVIK